MKAFIASLLTILFLVTASTDLVLEVRFDRNIGGHLKRAGDANSVDLAKQELAVAVEHMEDEGLTSGYTSILWTTPDEDIGFWYTNVKTALAELDSLPTTATQLERSNMLIKLRETLLDHTQKGESVTVPSGISLYPHNGLFVVLLFGSLVGAIVAWFWWYNDNSY